MADSKQYFIDRHEGGEAALLVQINFPNTIIDAEERLSEFADLALAANLTVLGTVTGKRTAPTPKYFVGEGKAEEIRDQVLQQDAEVVLFNHELTPGQGRNLEKLFNCRVIDRTELILDIFAQRARTFEGKLQVELAQLEHLRTRLVRGWTHLERQKGGIGLRGPGETQLETDRRLVGLRIKSIRKRLDKVQQHRAQGRRARQRADIPTVSLVGYTNAGKSTLFNQLTQADVYVADQLFASLDPTLRHIMLPQIGKTIVADTVGFVRDLPHDLLAAFRATLEETRQAHLLLHVVDCAGGDTQQTIERVNWVLEEIGADEVPQLLVFNKIDLSGQEPRIDYHEDGRPRRVWMSAQTGQGLELLQRAVVECLANDMIVCVLVLSPEQGKLRAALYRCATVLNETFEDGNIVLRLVVKRKDYERLELVDLVKEI